MDLKSEIYKSPNRTVSHINQFDCTSDIHDFNDDDDDDDDDDIIDLSSIQFPNDDKWLLPFNSNKSSNDNISDWLHRDLNQLKDIEYEAQHLLIQRELSRLNELESEAQFSDKNAYINSRTFTRPKKKLTRPNLEEYTFGQPYQKNSFETPREDFTEHTSDISRRINQLKSKLLLANSNNISNIPKKDDTQVDQKDDIISTYLNGMNSISAERNKAHPGNNMDASLKPFKHSFDPKMSDSLHTIPSLTNSFTLSNETSINESDFITAMTQPEDLFMSFTSVAASDTSEDQNTFTNNYLESEGFAENIKELNETFSKSFHFSGDENEDFNATFNAESNDNYDDDINRPIVDKTFTPPNYFATFKKKPQYISSGPESITFTSVSDNNPNFKTFRKLKPAHLVNETINLNNTIDIEPTVSGIEENGIQLNKTVTKSERLINDLNNTFVALPETQKISTSDPNLLENSLEYLNTTFSKTKEVAGSAESLDISSSVSDCSSNSYRVLNMEQVDQMARMQEKSLILGSTPKSKLTKKIWGSSETFSTTSLNISNITIDHDGTRRLSASSSAHSSPTKGSLKDIYKATRISPRSLRLPSKSQSPIEQPIPTPMEPPSRPPIPAEVPTMKEPNPSVVPIKRSQLRQPMIRASGLPRPTNSASVLSSIPRPQSRIPGSSQLRASASRPSTASSDRLDGCY